LHQPYDKRQILAGAVSFFGVILIARPDKLWFNSSPDIKEGVQAVTPIQRLWAVIMVLISDLGATAAFTTIRVIGPRAHPLISVNYYGFIAMLMSGIFLFLPILPDVSFRLPHDSREWTLLLSIGIFGFGLQFLMTAGLVKDKSARATNMMYSSVIFGLGMDWIIWGLVPGWTSWVGGGIVVAATLWVALQKAEVVEASKQSGEYGLLATRDRDDEAV
jgi:drug/metabolite transporter (DMT)-like permease